MLVGHIREIWRYPVKSLGGESLADSHVHDIGLAGDRVWALVDEQTGDICNAKRFPKLLNLQASFLMPPANQMAYGEQVAGIAVRFPDGETVEGRGQASKAISEYIGKALLLQPLEPPENLEHYRLATPLDDVEFARLLNVQPGEAELDLSEYEDKTLAMLAEYACPPGTYFDAFPLHLLTTASLDYMSTVSGVAFDARRWGPAIYLICSNNKW